MPSHGHARLVAERVACAVLTVSDTRSEADDTSGSRVKALLGAAGHTVAGYRIVPDDPRTITDAVTTFLDAPAVDAVILNGGTGLAPRESPCRAWRGRLRR